MAQISTTPSSAGQLLRIIGAVRRHAQLVWWATTILGTVGAAGLLLLLAVFADQYLVLPAAIRLLLLLGVLAGPAFVLRACLLRRPQADDEETALLIERRYPTLDNLLINTLQLSREPHNGSGEIIDAVATDADQAVRTIRPSAAVPKRLLAIAAGATLLALLIFAVKAATDAQALGTGLNRVLAPLGDNALTKINAVVPGDEDVLALSDVEFEVQLAGRVPTQAQLVGTYADGSRVNLPMLARSQARPDVLVARIRGIEQDLRYHVEAGDAESDAFTVRVHQRPAIERITQRVLPPDYIDAPATEQIGGAIEAVEGARAVISVTSTTPLSNATLVLEDGTQRAMVVEPAPGASNRSLATGHVIVGETDRYRIELSSALGFASEPAAFDVIAIQDRLPQVEFVQPANDIEAAIDAEVAVQIRATDDFAVQHLTLRRVPDPAAEDAGDAAITDPIELDTWTAGDRRQATFVRQATLNVAELGLSESTPIVLQAAARDWRPHSAEATSRVLVIRLEPPPSLDSTGAQDYGPIALEQLIDRQKTNIAASEDRRDLAGRPDDEPTTPVDDHATIVRRQESIRAEALALIAPSEDRPTNPVVRDRLQKLADTLMVVAVEQLRQVSPDGRSPAAWDQALQTQRAILAELLAANTRQDDAIEEYRQRELAAFLDELITRQRNVRDETAEQIATAAALSARQRVLGRDAALFQRQVAVAGETGAGGNPELAAIYTQIANGFEQREVRSNMLLAAASLVDGSFSGAVPRQDRVLADLAELQKLFRDAAMAQAKQQLEETAMGLEDAKDRLDKMTQLQQAIAEVAAELRKAKDLRDDEAEVYDDDLQDLVEARENMEEALEQLINDMHLIPEMDASNDLLAELSEIYEDVKQVEGSEQAPVSEMAVDRDEGLLNAFKAMRKKMEERIGDLEMWLSDKPDSTQWNMESFDRDEMGKVPLGDLPDVLEDIVGDLLDQAEDLEKEAMDSLSNQVIPDGVMGWDIDDGPMPSWAAKGKSGNKRPDQFEQTGRSGSGRQGESSGEIVGDTLKALEGSEVRARRTNDGFQSGELQEEDAGAHLPKATGGGKLAGATYGEGMEGEAPVRDELRYRQLERQHMDLMRQTESTYSKAKLLRLPTGELDRALLEMDAASRRLEAGDIQGFLRGQQEVVKALRQTESTLTGKQVVELPDESARTDVATIGATGEPVPEQYEDAVADYMRQIAE